MDIKESIWEGLRRLDFEFEGRNCILVCPENPLPDKKWLYKTEYFGAFPNFEIEMVKRGYYLAHIETESRWNLASDDEVRPLFVEFVISEFGLNKKCIPVGMSCGGMQAVYFAAEYPQYVAAMYIDAPVMNFLSCPFAVGKATTNFIDQFVEQRGMTLSEMLNFRNHPIDVAHKLVEARIPLCIVSGDSDTVVPYCENGVYLAKMYKKASLPLLEIVKAGCDHHPHGLSDPTPIIEFVEKHY